MEGNVSILEKKTAYKNIHSLH